jgi:large subunit ribosomal protein L15
MRLHDLRPAPGAHKPKRRIGRGSGSGRGTYSGKGLKGQKARSGGGVPQYFEGGQLPMVKRLPHKRGFTNIFRIEHSEVNIARLSAFTAGSDVTPQALADAGIVKSATKHPIKILGEGELDRALNVHAHRFSASAKQKIEAAGGTVTELPAWRRPAQRPEGALRRVEG